MFYHIIVSTAVCTGICICAAPLQADGNAADAVIEISPGRAAIFAGERADYFCTISTPQAVQGRLQWSLHVDGAVAIRRESAVRVDAGLAANVGMQFDAPVAKAGVILPAALRVSLVVEGRDIPAVSAGKQLWIYPKNPFHDRSEWLKRLDIRMFDPAGDTRQVFEKAGIPFAQINNFGTLAELDRGLLVVGQGISLNEYPGLADAVTAAASRGVAVLWLAPREGRFILPGTADSVLARPTAVALRGADTISEFDKRLDAEFWPEDGRVAAASFAIGCDRGRVVAVADASDANWSWLEFRFAAAKGRLIVCGFDIAGKWESGPTPRFLLAHIMEYLDEQNNLPLIKERSDESF